MGTEDVDRRGSLPQVVHEDLSSGGAHRHCHPVRLDINGGQGRLDRDTLHLSITKCLLSQSGILYFFNKSMQSIVCSSTIYTLKSSEYLQLKIIVQ